MRSMRSIGSGQLEVESSQDAFKQRMRFVTYVLDLLTSKMMMTTSRHQLTKKKSHIAK